MRKKKSSSKLGGCLVTPFLFFALSTVVWIAVPYLAQRIYGAPASHLTGFSRFNFSWQVLANRGDLQSPVNTAAGESTFEIQPDESVTSIAERLEDSGLIRDASAFRAYLVYKGYDSRVIAGRFKLSPGVNSLEIAQQVQSSFSQSVSFYIYPGWRAEEIAAALPTSGIEVDPQRFLLLVHNPHMLEIESPYADFPSLDGFLFPGEYEIDRNVNEKELVSIFLEEFKRQVSIEVIDGIQSQGLSLYEGVTLASIIQRETFKDDERSKMASVFYNRLENEMKLETDPTVQYSLGYSERWGWWKTPLAIADLAINSTYNTYQNYGLPPTPISNPDLPSLLAVAYPEETGYFYFRAFCDDSGYHDFSVTFEEHLAKACE